MTLADSSIWIDHIRQPDPLLSGLLADNRLLGHSMVTTELALGSLKDRTLFLESLDLLPQAPIASVREVRILIETAKLFSRGLGFVDTALLASCLISEARLWTRDKRLAAVADELGIGWPITG